MPFPGAAAVIAGSGLNFLSSMIGRSQSLADWRRQNKYNEPANQVRLLKNAGLSPALMYAGGGNVVPASPIPQTGYNLNTMDQAGIPSKVNVQTEDAIARQLANRISSIDADFAERPGYQGGLNMREEVLMSEYDVKMSQAQIQGVAANVAAATQPDQIDRIVKDAVFSSLRNKIANFDGKKAEEQWRILQDMNAFGDLFQALPGASGSAINQVIGAVLRIGTNWMKYKMSKTK